MAIRGLLALTVLATVAPFFASPATAASPIKGARYFGFHGDVYEAGELTLLSQDAGVRVSRRGGTFTRGSYLKYDFLCGSRGSGPEGTIDLAPRRGRRLRIRRNGTFSLVKREGRVTFRLHGRFVTRRAAQLVYRVRVALRRPNRRGPRICASGPKRVALYRNGQPPFSGCGARAHELVRGSTGRVFEQYRLLGNGRGGGGEFYPHAYGCLYETDKRVLLGRNYDDETVDLPRVAGPYSAYEQSGCCSIVVIDLRSGARVRTVGSLGSYSSMDFYPGRAVSDLELKANSSLAWISQARNTGARPEVWGLDALGQRMLDSGADIDSGSLSLSGSTLTWRRGGAVRSATLN